jgi:hypothetical protein
LKDKNQQQVIRLMAPFSMRCNSCGEYIYKVRRVSICSLLDFSWLTLPSSSYDLQGKKFNARKETVTNEDYYGIRIFRFYIKCTLCSTEITFKTDPKNADYICEHGASRNFEVGSALGALSSWFVTEVLTTTVSLNLSSHGVTMPPSRPRRRTCRTPTRMTRRRVASRSSARSTTMPWGPWKNRLRRPSARWTSLMRSKTSGESRLVCICQWASVHAELTPCLLYRQRNARNERVGITLSETTAAASEKAALEKVAALTAAEEEDEELVRAVFARIPAAGGAVSSNGKGKGRAVDGTEGEKEDEDDEANERVEQQVIIKRKLAGAEGEPTLAMLLSEKGLAPPKPAAMATSGNTSARGGGGGGFGFAKEAANGGGGGGAKKRKIGGPMGGLVLKKKKWGSVC